LRKAISKITRRRKKPIEKKVPQIEHVPVKEREAATEKRKAIEEKGLQNLLGAQNIPRKLKVPSNLARIFGVEPGDSNVNRALVPFKSQSRRIKIRPIPGNENIERPPQNNRQLVPFKRRNRIESPPIPGDENIERPPQNNRQLAPFKLRRLNPPNPGTAENMKSRIRRQGRSFIRRMREAKEFFRREGRFNRTFVPGPGTERNEVRDDTDLLRRQREERRRERGPTVDDILRRREGRKRDRGTVTAEDLATPTLPVFSQGVRSRQEEKRRLQNRIRRKREELRRREDRARALDEARKREEIKKGEEEMKKSDLEKGIEQMRAAAEETIEKKRTRALQKGKRSKTRMRREEIRSTGEEGSDSAILRAAKIADSVVNKTLGESRPDEEEKEIVGKRPSRVRVSEPELVSPPSPKRQKLVLPSGFSIEEIDDESAPSDSGQLPPSTEGSGSVSGILTPKGGFVDYELAGMMMHRPEFVGTFCRDEISKIPMEKFPLAAIVNEDVSTGPGTHWTALWIPGNASSVEVFDPLADPIDVKKIQEISKLLNKARLPTLAKFKVNNVKVQDARRGTCGLHCVKYLLSRIHKIPYKVATQFDRSGVEEQKLPKFPFI